MTGAAVFLDRDGVLDQVDPNGWGPLTLSDLQMLDEAPDAVRRLRGANFVTVVVTNQPDVARGSLTLATANAINDQVQQEAGVDFVYTCFHDGDDCPCRKPRPGMLLDAAADLDLDLDRSWLIGDRWVDIEAGRAAGVRTVLLEAPYSWQPTGAGAPPDGLLPLHRAGSLGDCVDFVLAGSSLRSDEQRGSP